MSSYDILIKNGTVVDGSGAPARSADVAIVDGRIAEVGKVEGKARRTIDAAGRLVTPGFVDIHSHLDAQFAWDPIGSSSCWHGVTSVVVGNCGVTFAPVRPTDHEKLARLMESVEDIPADAIMAGLAWNWQTYGEYYDALDAMPKGINVGGMVGHCALRFYAMGDRCLDSKNQPSDDELAVMVEAVDEALAAGALGVSSSRILGHRTPQGQPVPGTFAERRELFALADPLRRRGRGLFELVPRFETDDPATWHKSQREMDWMADLSRATGRPVTYSFFQFPHLPTQYRALLEMTHRCNAAGANIRPQTTARGIGVLFGPRIRSPFDRNPAWRAMRSLSVAEKLAVYADPVRRAELVREAQQNGPFADELARLYVLEGPDPDYTPDAARALPAIATARGVSLAEAYMDVMLASAGTAYINHLDEVTGTIDESKNKKGKDPKTFREQLAMHASRAACANCHAKIDPLGFGLENFDAVGRWRPNSPEFDATGKLPSGETFAGPAELKKLLMTRKGVFLENLTGKMLSYAAGRELTPGKNGLYQPERNGAERLDVRCP